MFSKLRFYTKILNAGEIFRRYFIINSFDGVLTTIGVLVGAFISGGFTNREIILVVIATGLSMFVSGFGGALLTEKAEREKAIKELEKVTLKKLDKSIFKKASEVIILLTGIVNGVSPLLVSILIIFPFFILTNQTECFLFSISVAFILLLVLGGCLGKVSKRNIILSGLEMLIVGIVAIGIILLLKIF